MSSNLTLLLAFAVQLSVGVVALGTAPSQCNVLEDGPFLFRQVKLHCGDDRRRFKRIDQRILHGHVKKTNC